MSFIDELKWRGMLHDLTPGVEEHLEKGMAVGYIGFDPTAPSMTIGNYVQIMILKHWQLAGHKPIALFGGATGRIGDPSGKDKERELKTGDELDNNLAHQQAQIRKFLNFDSGENKAIMVNNYDFYKNMNVLDFLRDVGKTIGINYMLAKDSVKNRLETGMSFTEFSYQLLQGYDFQCLFTQENCSIQMGGSDQWGNITAGTEFIRRNLSEKAYALTTPLLTRADGKKFGKSEQGNIWLDPNLTSPYKFYQFWINADDADLPKYFRYFSLKSKAEIENLELEHKDNPRELKRILAEELTIRVHSEGDYQTVLKISETLFSKEVVEILRGSDMSFLKTLASSVNHFSISKSDIENGIPLLELLVEKMEIISSRTEGRKAIQNNSIAINKVKMTQPDGLLTKEHLIQNGYILLESGKKEKYMLILE